MHQTMTLFYESLNLSELQKKVVLARLLFLFGVEAVNFFLSVDLMNAVVRCWM